MTFSPAILLAAFGGLVATTGAAPLAFSGAEGYGRFASGGRGGQVLVVTNLNDSGPGSLRAATSESGPRTVVFAVSGTIHLLSTLRITRGDLTIAGQTAPGDGICLADHPLDPSNSQNVIIRFIRSRLGDVAQLENDAFSCRYADNIIIDHCSFSWGVDETVSAYINTNFTMQWCIVSESLRNSFHSKGTHGYGGIWGGMGASFHHNLLAHHDSRNPRFSGAAPHGLATELVDLRNNVIYNWGFNSCYGGEPVSSTVPSRQNMVNNYYKYGPATSSGVRGRILNPTTVDGPYGLFHVAGNYVRGNSTITADNWAGGVQGPSAAALTAMRTDPAFAVAPVTTQTAQDAYPLILSHAGCVRPARDAVDTRVISEVTNGTTTYLGSKSVNPPPGLIDSQTDVGGWPVLATSPPPADADADGMPDVWENSHGLNPNDPSDRNLTNSGGYTRLEIYLDSLAAGAFPITSAAVFSTTFGGNTLHAASPVLTPTSTNWYVMSSKNATGSSVGDDPATTSVTETRPLDLTMAVTSSGITESAALFAAQPVALLTGNGTLRTRIIFRPTNVLTMGVGIFNSGGTSPHTGLINSLLNNTATSFGTGGTQNWLGYRFAITNNSAAAVIQARPAQPGTNNASQSLVAPTGTTSSCPTWFSAAATIPASPTTLTFTDGATYTLTTELSRPSADQLLLSCTIHGGTDTSNTPLFSSSSLTTAAGALPSAVTSAFNAVAIGYRNVNNLSVSHLTVTSLEIAKVGVIDPYQAFIFQHGLDPLTDGAFPADPDGDGIANVLEFVLGGNPTVGSRASLPVLTRNSPSEWTFSFLRHEQTAQIAALVVERSTDAKLWIPLTDGIEVAPAINGYQLVTVHLAAAGDRLFVRLKCTAP